MARLIDADALKKSIEELKRSPWFNSVLNPAWHAGIKEAVEVVEHLCIDKAPTIDAVPVIRCRDCRNLLTVAWIGDEAEPYAWMCDHWHMSTDPEGHCHKAERSTDGNRNE